MSVAGMIGAAAVGSAIQAFGSSRINSANIRYQEEANRLSQDLANTAHQREVADLRAAGLNPILSAGGSGAATPQLGVPALDNPMAGLGNSAAAVGRELARYKSEQYELQNDQIAAQTANLNSSRAVIEAEAELKRAMADSIRAGRSIPEALAPASENLGAWIGEKIGVSSASRAERLHKDTSEPMYPYKGRYRTLGWLLENDPDYLEEYHRNHK